MCWSPKGLTEVPIRGVALNKTPPLNKTPLISELLRNKGGFINRAFLGHVWRARGGSKEPTAKRPEAVWHGQIAAERA